MNKSLLDMMITKNDNGTYHVELFIMTEAGLEPVMNYDVESINVQTELGMGVN